MYKEKTNQIVTKLPYLILALIGVCMVLTGCELHEPTKLSQNRIQVEEDKYADSVPVKDLSDNALEVLAMHYRKHGDGPLELTVTYDPKASSTGAMKATDEAARLSKALRSKGVDRVTSGILPIKDSGSQMNALIAYNAYYAQPPKDCTIMPGLDKMEIEAEKDYKLGCTTDTLFARQIARPKDLKGQGPSDPTTDGRRLAVATDAYRDGIPNQPLEGERATE